MSALEEKESKAGSRLDQLQKYINIAIRAVIRDCEDEAEKEQRDIEQAQIIFKICDAVEKVANLIKESGSIKDLTSDEKQELAFKIAIQLSIQLSQIDIPGVSPPRRIISEDDVKFVKDIVADGSLKGLINTTISIINGSFNFGDVGQVVDLVEDVAEVGCGCFKFGKKKFGKKSSKRGKGGKK